MLPPRHGQRLSHNNGAFDAQAPLDRRFLYELDADDQAMVEELARLPLVAYGRVRKAAAKQLDCPVGLVDAAVTCLRRTLRAPGSTMQGQPLGFPRPQPSPEAVDGGILAAELVAFFSRHIVLPPYAAIALALWAIHTHCYELWRYTPRIHVRGPAPNSGKTRVLTVLGFIVCKPAHSVNATAAALFRVIDQHHPTALIDEVDLYLKSSPDLIATINSGHECDTPTWRVEGDNHEVRAFDSFAPVALAGIGRLPGPTETRCIGLLMKRARQGEMPEDITETTKQQGARFSSQIARFVQDNHAGLANATPNMGDLVNRLRNNWQPLYCIAHIIGDNWPLLARQAMAELTAGYDDDTATLGEKLLSDIQAAFVQVGADELSSAELLRNLINLEGRPWAEFGKCQRPLTVNGLAYQLKAFGVTPAKVYWQGSRVNGYKLTCFAEAFARYLPTTV